MTLGRVMEAVGELHLGGGSGTDAPQTRAARRAREITRGGTRTYAEAGIGRRDRNVSGHIEPTEFSSTPFVE